MNCKCFQGYVPPSWITLRAFQNSRQNWSNRGRGPIFLYKVLIFRLCDLELNIFFWILSFHILMFYFVKKWLRLDTQKLIFTKAPNTNKWICHRVNLHLLVLVLDCLRGWDLFVFLLGRLVYGCILNLWKGVYIEAIPIH